MQNKCLDFIYKVVVYQDKETGFTEEGKEKVTGQNENENGKTTAQEISLLHTRNLVPVSLGLPTFGSPCHKNLSGVPC